MVLKGSELITESELTDQMIVLSGLLRSSGIKFATAESCTGGLIAKVATDLSGSSEWFDRGLVTYSNEAKQDLLGVSDVTLDRYGAVSSEVVDEMVKGLLRFKAVSIGVAVSGIAGPDGGSDNKPVGTVWLAWKNAHHSVISQCFIFKGNRDQIRLQSSLEAIKGLIRLLKNDQ